MHTHGELLDETIILTLDGPISASLNIAYPKFPVQKGITLNALCGNVIT